MKLVKLSLRVDENMIRRCPECEIEMEEMYISAGVYASRFFVHVSKTWGRLSKHAYIKAYVCPKCGLVSLYKE